MTGHELRRLRERENVSRHYVSHYLKVSMDELSLIECSVAEADEHIVRGYKNALRHVRSSSLPARERFRLIWSVPRMNEKGQ